MAKDNIFAYTAPGVNPGYVSIKRTLLGDVVVSVREAPAVREGVVVKGNTAELVLPATAWKL